jgi:hypothetical protein
MSGYMNRRRLLGGLVACAPLRLTVAAIRPSVPPRTWHRPENSLGRARLAAMIPLVPSGPVSSHVDGQVLENLDIDAGFGDAVTVVHRGVTVRNCRIRHAAGHGIYAEAATGLVLEDLEIACLESSGARVNRTINNVNIENSPNAVITRVKASWGSSNIYTLRSECTRMSFLELHDARGPAPRGQNVQFDKSPNSILEDFSAENGPTSWTEDNVSVFQSDRCVVRRGLVSYNNSPSGEGVMIEGSLDCAVEDVDAVQQGNGAFAAVPSGGVNCGGCTFLRCRTRDSYNTKRDGRAAPSSNGLSFYTLISPGARKHTIIDCHYDGLANPKNLIWKSAAVDTAWSFTPQIFAPRKPIRLVFGW